MPGALTRDCLNSMLILGINSAAHDSAAALLLDGDVVAAVEEERLNRVKHTNVFPIAAVRSCLGQAQVSLHDIDRVAVNVAEEALVRLIARQVISQSVPRAFTPATLLAQRFAGVGLHVRESQLRCVAHHVSHAASAYFLSGFDDGLVLTVDGIGDDAEVDGASGALFRARGTRLERLKTFRDDESLGFLYGQITKFLGFEEFDEYKVMGLASYGDGSAHAALFAECCTLTPDGWYRLDRLRLAQAITRLVADMPSDTVAAQRRKSDIAAACQNTLERIVLHVLRHYARVTGERRLAMAGGVALNCSLIARILEANLFADVFVQPAAHDAGGALGAAAYVASQEGNLPVRRTRLRTVYWGADTPAPGEIERTLQQWSPFVEWQRADDVIAVAARHLAAGAVIGWVQGRSEFGPRALGNRSILADPRDEGQRDLVNRMIKRREDFRPFAPSVPAEKAADYFEMPAGSEDLPFMLSTVRVRRDQRARLGAVTHVDGTARIQTVSRTANPRYWELLHAFGDLTGVYVLLNTSFNNSAEPIVDSVEDAIVAYVTTGLHYLVVGDYWVSKRDGTDDRILDSILSIASCADVSMVRTDTGWTSFIRYKYEAARRKPIVLAAAAEVIRRADGATPLRDLLDAAADASVRSRIVEEVRRLWWLRLVRLQPGVAAWRDQVAPQVPHRVTAGA